MDQIKHILFFISVALIVFSCGSEELSQIDITTNISGKLDIATGETLAENTLIYKKFITTNANTGTLLNLLRLPTDKVSDIVPKEVTLNIVSEGKGDLNYFRQVRVFLTTSPDDTLPDNVLENWVQIARLDTIKTTSQKSLTLIPEIVSLKSLILDTDPDSLFITSIMETRKIINDTDTFNTNIITNYHVSGKVD